MKVCARCGRDVQDVDNFCPKCGNTKFTDKILRQPLQNCGICGGSTDYLWTCAKCGKQVCRNCTKTSGYLDIMCTSCAKKESEHPLPEEPKIEVIEAPKQEGFISKIISWFGNLFSKREPPEEVNTQTLPPPGSAPPEPSGDKDETGTTANP